MMKNRVFSPTFGVFGALILTGVVLLLPSCKSPEPSVPGTSPDATTAYESVTAVQDTEASFDATTEPTGVTDPENTQTEPTRPSIEEPSSETTSPSQASTPAASTGTTDATENVTTESTTDRPTETDSEPTVSQEETTGGNLSEDTMPVFAFTKLHFDPNSSTDLYEELVKLGYHYIQDEEELASYGAFVLQNMTEQKEIHYILAETNRFGAITEQMERLIEAAKTEETQNTPSPMDFEERDRYFYDLCGLDYQTYYAQGMGLFRIRHVQDVSNLSSSYSVYAIYFYSYTTVEQNAEVEDAVNAIIRNLGGTDYEKIKAVHDYLCANVTYNLDSAFPHTAYGALIKNECVCEGYAKAMKLLMDALEIPCSIVMNDTHAWNEVLLDGKWYVIDVTNDAEGSKQGGTYTYFLLGEESLVLFTDLNEEEEKHMRFYNYADQRNTSHHELAESDYE